MNAPQRPGDEERDRLANSYVWWANWTAEKDAFISGWDKAMERAQETLNNVAAHVERRDREISNQRQFIETQRMKIIKLEAEVKRLTEACMAAVAYDDAIRACANDPNKMSSFCSAQGDSLDFLYEDWMIKAREALAPRRGGE